MSDSQDGVGLGLAPFLIPVLFPPGYGFYFTWTATEAAHLPPLASLAAVCIEIAVMVYGLVMFFRHTEEEVVGIVLGLYVAFCYGVVPYVFHADLAWTIGFGAVGGLIGFYSGKCIARQSHDAANAREWHAKSVAEAQEIKRRNQTRNA